MPELQRSDSQERGPRDPRRTRRAGESRLRARAGLGPRRRRRWRLLAAFLLLALPIFAAAEDDDDRQAERARMVEDQIESRGVRDARVLDAMRTVPRHRFVPAAVREHAYEDRPLPIGSRQTISQPYIVALMTELAELQPAQRVLEIGTGSGYQAAVLAKLVKRVYSIEILPELAQRAARDLEAAGFDNVTVIAGDGYRGLPEQAPFDAILVTAAPGHVPEPLMEQLAVGGRLVIPVGDDYQELMVFERTADGIRKRTVIPVRFVPMTGEAQKPR